MRMIKSIMLSTTVALFLVGCSDTDKEEVERPSTLQQSAPIFVSGQTTLASAKVCLDINHNAQCDEDDLATIADATGHYTIESSEAITADTLLIAEDGYNLILEQNNNGRFRFVSLYDEALSENNINTITSLLTQLVNERDLSNEEAQVYLAERYEIDRQELLDDPIVLAGEQKETLLLLVHGIESGYAEAMNTSSRRSVLRAAATETTYVTPNLEDTEDFLSDGSYLSYDVGTYMTRVSLKIETFLDEVRYFLVDTFSLCIWYCPSGSQLKHEVLAGVWYVHPQFEGEDLCVEIDAQDNYLEHHDEGNRLYSIYFSEINNKISIIDGWDVLETHAIVGYDDANRFDLGSDNNASRYTRMENLNACEERVAAGSSIREGVTKIKGQVIVAEGAEILSLSYTNNQNYRTWMHYDENGSFIYQSRDSYEDPWITEWSEKMFIKASVSVNNGPRVVVPFSIDKEDMLFLEENHMVDVGALEVRLTHVKACINDETGNLAEGNYAYFIDHPPYNESTQNIEINSGIIEFDVLQDSREHTLYVLDNRYSIDGNISRVSFAVTERLVDLSANCATMQEGISLSTEITAQKSYDANITSLVIYGERGLAVSERVEEGVAYSDFNMSENGEYSVFISNNTTDKEVIKGTEVSITIGTNTYHTRVEHASTLNLMAFRVFYYNGVVTGVYDAYGHRLD